MKSDNPNVPKQAKTKRNGQYNKPNKLQFHSIFTQKILMLSKRYESTEIDINYECPSFIGSKVMVMV